MTSWNSHINSTCTSANKTLGFLKRNIKVKHEGVRERAYTSLVRPKLEYASPVWSPYTERNINKIEMIQRRAARWVKDSYSRHLSVTSMLDQLGWRTLERRRSDTKLVMFYKIVHQLIEIPIPPYLKHPIRPTRHDQSLSFIQIRTTVSYYQYSFFPSAIVLWNRLPNAVVTLSDLDQFKLTVAKTEYSI